MGPHHLRSSLPVFGLDLATSSIYAHNLSMRILPVSGSHWDSTIFGMGEVSVEICLETDPIVNPNSELWQRPSMISSCDCARTGVAFRCHGGVGIFGIK